MNAELVMIIDAGGSERDALSSFVSATGCGTLGVATAEEALSPLGEPGCADVARYEAKRGGGNAFRVAG